MALVILNWPVYVASHRDVVNALRDEVSDLGLPVFRWFVDRALKLELQNLPDVSLPGHPLLLLIGFYERVAEKKKRPAAAAAAGQFKIQSHFTKAIDVVVAIRLVDEFDSSPAKCARNLSNRQRGATAWLRAIPSHPSLRLAPGEFRLGVLYLLWSSAAYSLVRKVRCTSVSSTCAVLQVFADAVSSP